MRHSRFVVIFGPFKDIELQGVCWLARHWSDRDPYAQQLKLCWAIVGETCLDRQHKSSHLSVMRTHVLPSGRPSTFWSNTWCATGRSLPMSSRSWQLSSSGLMVPARSCRWKWFCTTCGVGISSLLSGMWSHSINVGRLKWMTPQVVQNHFHLHDLAGIIQPLDDSCQILLLIGRDLPVAHHVLDQKVGSDRDPYAQQLKLGWVIVELPSFLWSLF
jgi:hypothetical protein